MITLFDRLERNTADTYSLVLNSAGIGHRVVLSDGGYRIDVTETAVDAAARTIDSYLAENPASTTPTTPPPFHMPVAAVAVALTLLTVHLAIVTSSAPQDYARVFGADARRIVSGELYRCVTALLVHADAAHVGGNMVGLVLFGSAVCTLAGSGVGWMMILCCGIVGNLVNAMVHSHGHLSVGASTAVFGALGILCAVRATAAIRTGHGWKRVALLVGAGVALLAFLGTGANSDLGAHFFGCLAGIAIGAAYGWRVERSPRRGPPRMGLQVAAGIVSGATLLLSWVRGVLG